MGQRPPRPTTAQDVAQRIDLLAQGMSTGITAREPRWQHGLQSGLLAGCQVGGITTAAMADSGKNADRGDSPPSFTLVRRPQTGAADECARTDG
jgi:hypothetical protein